LRIIKPGKYQSDLEVGDIDIDAIKSRRQVSEAARG
jgi:hypothetical protein